MPAETSPSLEDLARAAVEAWRKYTASDPWNCQERFGMATAVYDLEQFLASPESPTRALDYMMPIRLQCELRLACALITHGYPTDDREAQAVIDRARILARLLLDGPDTR